LFFEAALGIEAEMLIRMQSQYNIIVAKSNSKFMQKLQDIKRIATVL
jgi:plasmid maintenance system antidote protein VapI